MAEKKYQNKWKKSQLRKDYIREKKQFKKDFPKYLDEAGAVASAGGAYFLGMKVSDVYYDLRKGYQKNITNMTKLKSGRGISKDKAILLKKDIVKKFKFPERLGKFGFFKKAHRGIKAINPKSVGSGLNKAQRDYLISRNKKLFRSVIVKNLPASLGYSALVFGSLPAVRSYQARYAKKRKFRKELKGTLKRGIVSPVYGYAVGKPLDDLLVQAPYLRASKTIRSKEGKYHQKYGQGVQFYKGTTGLKSEDIMKLSRDKRRRAELVRISKRRRGK